MPKTKHVRRTWEDARALAGYNEPDVANASGSNAINNNGSSTADETNTTVEVDESAGINNERPDIPDASPNTADTDNPNALQNDGSKAADGSNMVANAGDGLNANMDNAGGSNMAVTGNGEAPDQASLDNNAAESELAEFESLVAKYEEEIKERHEEIQGLTERRVARLTTEIKELQEALEQAKQEVSSLKKLRKGSQKENPSELGTGGTGAADAAAEKKGNTWDSKFYIDQFRNNMATFFDDITREPATEWRDELGVEGWEPMWDALGLTSSLDDGPVQGATTRKTRKKNKGGNILAGKPTAKQAPIVDDKQWSGLYLEVRESWDTDQDIWYTEPLRRPPNVNARMLCLCLYKELKQVRKLKRHGVANSTIIQSSQLFRLVNEYLAYPIGDATPLPLDAIGLVIQTATEYFEKSSGEKGDSLIVLSIWQLSRLLVPQNDQFRELYNKLCKVINDEEEPVERFPFNRKLIYKILTSDDDFLSAPKPHNGKVCQGIVVPKGNEVLVGRRLLYPGSDGPDSATNQVSAVPDFPVTIIQGPGKYHVTIIDERNKDKEPPTDLQNEWSRTYRYIFTVDRKLIEQEDIEQVDGGNKKKSGKRQVTIQATSGEEDPTRRYKFHIKKNETI